MDDRMLDGDRVLWFIGGSPERAQEALAAGHAWTPEQRAQRILRGGDDAAADAAADEDARERLAREQAAKRDAEIRAQIEQMVRIWLMEGPDAACAVDGAAPAEAD